MRDVFNGTDETQAKDKRIYEDTHRGLQKTLNAIFQNMRVQLNKDEPIKFNTMI